jgi:hypothetical protein
MLQEVVQQRSDLSGHDDRELSQPPVEVRMANLSERHSARLSLLMTIY